MNVVEIQQHIFPEESDISDITFYTYLDQIDNLKDTTITPITMIDIFPILLCIICACVVFLFWKNPTHSYFKKRFIKSKSFHDFGRLETIYETK